MPILVALGTLVAAVIVGVALMVGDHTLIGLVVLLAGLPLALVAWIALSERR
jgi:hypothetical protein